MLEDIYSWDENLTEDDYYEGLLFVMGDAYPHLSEEEIEDLLENRLARLPEAYAESIFNTIGNVGKSLGSGALKFAADNPELVRTGATVAGTAIGGPVGGTVGNMAAGYVTQQAAPARVMPETGKTLAIMQNPQTQTALARATLGIGAGTAPLATNGTTNLIPVATYLRAIIASAQNALRELDANNVIPPAVFSESLPNADDIDLQAEWLAEELLRN